MKKTLSIVLVMSVILLGLLTASSAQPSDSKIRIRVKGSDDMAGRIDALSRQFLQDHPNVNIIVSGGSTGTAFPEFLDGNCEVVMLGHSLTPEDKKAARDKGIQFTDPRVGYGAIVILTYPQNPLEELTVEQVQKLIKGDYTNWNQIGGADDPVVVVSVAAMECDTRVFILHDFLGVPSVKSHVERVPYFRALVEKVAQTRGGIGYCRLRDVEARQTGVAAKVLKIKSDANSPAVMPSRSTITDETYPIKRPFALCFNNRATEEVKRFVELIVSHGWGRSPERNGRLNAP